MYNKTIIRFGFCDIQNNQGLGEGYQPQPSASDDNPYLKLDYSGYHKNLIRELFIIGVGRRSWRTNQSHGSESSIVIGLFFHLCFRLRQSSFH